MGDDLREILHVVGTDQDRGLAKRGDPEEADDVSRPRVVGEIALAGKHDDPKLCRNLDRLGDQRCEHRGVQFLERGDQQRRFAVPARGVDDEVLAPIFVPGPAARERAAFRGQAPGAGPENEEGDENASTGVPDRPATPRARARALRCTG